MFEICMTVDVSNLNSDLKCRRGGRRGEAFPKDLQRLDSDRPFHFSRPAIQKPNIEMDERVALIALSDQVVVGWTSSAFAIADVDSSGLGEERVESRKQRSEVRRFAEAGLPDVG